VERLIQVGPYEVHALTDGSFALDGGAMFGVVPKVLWRGRIPPDDDNRIHMALRCLLLVDRRAGRVVLVETGMGTQWSDKLRGIYAVDQATSDLAGSLAAAGAAPEDVTDVFVTHLHFDHAGGLCRPEPGGGSVPAFSNATLHVQAANWRWAHDPTPRDRASYRPGDYVPYERAGRLDLVEGAAEVLPGIHVEPGVGHTTGHQVVRVSDASTHLVFPGDTVPTRAHLPTAWGMAYDLRPLELLAEKTALLDRLVDEGAVLAFDHDPEVAAATLRRGRRAVGVEEEVALG